MFVPDRIQKMISGRPYTYDSVGMSSSQVICFDDMVLKIEPVRQETENALKMMTWLQGRLPVPRILWEEKVDGTSYLLMSKIAGTMSCDVQYMEDPQKLVKLLVQGLELLWSVDGTDCPVDMTLSTKLKLARFRVENGLCDMENVEPETFGKDGFRSEEHLLQWLEDNRPDETLSVSHGDYCLPNIFLKDGKVSGFIDLGRSGLADKYQDIALCYRSLQHNFSGYFGKSYEGYEPSMLFTELGIQPDWEKIRYYILLDELF